MVRTRSASSSTTTILRSLVAYPRGTMPPTQSPLRLEAAILSRMLGGDFPLELGKGQQHIERQPAHRGRGIELLGDRDESDSTTVEQLDELGEIHQGAGQAVDLVDH